MEAGGYGVGSGALGTSALSSAAAANAGNPWDWQRELEVFAGRLSRGRAEEAAAVRRAAEEAERAALRRTEEVERRALVCQAEESAALQNFLSAWHGSLEARFEQFASQLGGLERRLEQDREKSSSSMEAVSSRMAGLDVEIKAALEPALASLTADVSAARQECKAELESRSREVAADVTRREAEGREAVAAVAARLESVEARSEAAARGLGALEPFVERVTARLDHLESNVAPAVESVRSELSAAGQVHRTAIAAESKRTEEGFAALHAQLTRHQESSDEKISVQEQSSRRLKEQVEELQTSAEASKAEAALHERGTESRLEALSASVEAMQASLRENGEAASQQLECFEARLQESAAAAASSLRSSEGRLEDLIHRELQQAASRAKVQEEAATALLTQELQELRTSSSEKLKSVTEECRSLQEELGRVKGQGVSHQWHLPRCLQRLRYLSLSSEPGLWLDSESFTLGGLGPLELRLYAKGLRGGDGQCAVALRLPVEAASNQAALPMLVDLAIADVTHRACQRLDPEGGGVMWLAESFGSLEDFTGSDELADVHVRAELPLLAAPALISSSLAASALGSSDDLTSVRRRASASPPASPLPSSGSIDALVQPGSRSVPARDARGVPAATSVQSRLSPQPQRQAASETPPPSSVSLGSPGSATEAPSGIFALRSAWGSPAPLPVIGNKVTNPFDENFSSGASTAGPSRSHAMAPAADNAAK